METIWKWIQGKFNTNICPKDKNNSKKVIKDIVLEKMNFLENSKEKVKRVFYISKTNPFGERKLDDSSPYTAPLVSILAISEPLSHKVLFVRHLEDKRKRNLIIFILKDEDLDIKWLRGWCHLIGIYPIKEFDTELFKNNGCNIHWSLTDSPPPWCGGPCHAATQLQQLNSNKPLNEKEVPFLHPVLSFISQALELVNPDQEIDKASLNDYEPPRKRLRRSQFIEEDLSETIEKAAHWCLDCFGDIISGQDNRAQNSSIHLLKNSGLGKCLCTIAKQISQQLERMNYQQLTLLYQIAKIVHQDLMPECHVDMEEQNFREFFRLELSTPDNTKRLLPLFLLYYLTYPLIEKMHPTDLLNTRVLDFTKDLNKNDIVDQDNNNRMNILNKPSAPSLMSDVYY